MDAKREGEKTTTAATGREKRELGDEDWLTFIVKALPLAEGLACGFVSCAIGMTTQDNTKGVKIQDKGKTDNDKHKIQDNTKGVSVLPLSLDDKTKTKNKAKITR